MGLYAMSDPWTNLILNVFASMQIQKFVDVLEQNV